MIYIEVMHSVWYLDEDKNFQDYLAQQYVEEVKKAVAAEKYKGSWRALSPGYRAFKANMGLSPKMWEATGELIDNLYVKSNRTVGFDGRKRHSRSRKRYIEIARELEYGSTRVPARPLFRKVLFDMKTDLDKWKQKYLEEAIANES